MERINWDYPVWETEGGGKNEDKRTESLTPVECSQDSQHTNNGTLQGSGQRGRDRKDSWSNNDQKLLKSTHPRSMFSFLRNFQTFSRVVYNFTFSPAKYG